MFSAHTLFDLLLTLRTVGSMVSEGFDGSWTTVPDWVSLRSLTLLRQPTVNGADCCWSFALVIADLYLDLACSNALIQTSSKRDSAFMSGPRSPANIKHLST